MHFSVESTGKIINENINAVSVMKYASDKYLLDNNHIDKLENTNYVSSGK